MARIRSIHPDAHQSEKLASLTSDAERLYWRLQGHCDDHGRCEDNPRLIWGMTCSLISSWTHLTVHDLLQELAAVGLVARYEADGKRCIQVTRWGDYQHPQRPKPSLLPPVPDTYATSTRHVTEPSLTHTGDVDAGGERRQSCAGSQDMHATGYPQVSVDNPVEGLSPAARAALHALETAGHELGERSA